MDSILKQHLEYMYDMLNSKITFAEKTVVLKCIDNLERLLDE